MSSKPRATVIKFGMGNIHSLVAAIEFLGFTAEVTADPQKIQAPRLLILPGVGSFATAMRRIKDQRTDDALAEALQVDSTRLLGICLGMQLLGKFSTEDGGAEGLGLLDFTVERFSFGDSFSLPVPHIGFNDVDADHASLLFKNLEPKSDFYFVHSFRTTNVSNGASLAFTTYGERFVSAVETAQTMGVQFHPEKSQTNGLTLLQNFLEGRN